MSHTDEHCADLLGAYFLGACTEREVEFVERHLATCTACSALAERVRQGGEVLLNEPAPVAPPAQVKESVMAQVRADAELFDAARGRAEAPAAKRSWWSSLRDRGWRPLPAAALAGALLLAGLAGALVSGALRSDEPDTRVFAADVRPAGGSASLEVTGERAELQVRGLPQPGPGRVYQVWVRRGREVPRPAKASFRVDQSGAGRALVPGGVGGVDEVLVTSEPARGSPLPTRPPVLQVATPSA